jgi:hypothetical protein
VASEGTLDSWSFPSSALHERTRQGVSGGGKQSAVFLEQTISSARVRGHLDSGSNNQTLDKAFPVERSGQVGEADLEALTKTIKEPQEDVVALLKPISEYLGLTPRLPSLS